MNKLSLKRTNTILYCQRWSEMVDFYQHRLGLPITFRSSWFVEFRLSETAYLSVADEQRATIKSSAGAGITLTLQVENIEETWQSLKERGVNPGPIKAHAWGAYVFYFSDPEGYRLEVWSPIPPLSGAHEPGK